MAGIGGSVVLGFEGPVECGIGVEKPRPFLKSGVLFLNLEDLKTGESAADSISASSTTDERRSLSLLCLLQTHHLAAVERTREPSRIPVWYWRCICFGALLCVSSSTPLIDGCTCLFFFLKDGVDRSALE